MKLWKSFWILSFIHIHTISNKDYDSQLASLFLRYCQHFTHWLCVCHFCRRGKSGAITFFKMVQPENYWHFKVRKQAEATSRKLSEDGLNTHHGNFNLYFDWTILPEHSVSHPDDWPGQRGQDHGAVQAEAGWSGHHLPQLHLVKHRGLARVVQANHQDSTRSARKESFDQSRD